MTLVGKLLSKARQQQRLSQSVVAQRAKIPPAQLSQIESGTKKDPHFSTVSKIAAVLNLSLDDLAQQMHDSATSQAESNLRDENDPIAYAKELKTIAFRLQSIAEQMGSDE